MREREEILCAALEIDGMVFSMPRPKRHHHIIHEIAKKFKLEEHTQGFLTNRGRFVGRETGCKIAVKANQIMKKHGPKDELFSEDMW